MLSLVHREVNLGTIAWFTNRHITTVRKWIMRSKTGAELCDQKRSGRPPVYNEKTQLKTIAFYCQVSPLPGCNSWSLRWAENYLKEHSEIIGCSMSHSTIQRILKSHGLRPHLHKYFWLLPTLSSFQKWNILLTSVSTHQSTCLTLMNARLFKPNPRWPRNCPRYPTNPTTKNLNIGVMGP